MTALSHASSTTTARVRDPVLSAAAPRAEAREDSDGPLAQIMPLMRLALWEAWDDPLELIALQFGRSDGPTLPLEAAQMEPGASWNENIYPGDQESVRAFLDAPETVRTGKSVDYRLIVAEGELLWVRHWLLQRDDSQEGRRRFQGLLLPIPEQKHLEWECLRVSERECNRIGHELHDDLCQVLGGMAFMIQVLGQRAAKSAPGLVSEIEELNAQVSGAADRVRAMAHGLFPARLSHATLRDALHEFAEQTRARFSVRFTLELPRRLPSQSPEQVIQVYRIAQEAVGNAVRHGGARAIRLAVTTPPCGLQIDIEDDGCGFPVTTARPEGIGLHVMQYRARALGGTIRFDNLWPRGAGVHLQYPAAHSPSNLNRKTTQLP